MTDPNNLSLWRAVCRTDPAYTKHVRARGGFTAIDAYYQVMQATAQWGPMGARWGVMSCSYERVEAGKQVLIVCEMTIYYPDEGSSHGYRALDKDEGERYGELWSCGRIPGIAGTAALVDDKGKVDSDAWKKAYTGALTKALSYLGFSADVFLGKFDDPQYVHGQRKRVHEERQERAKQHRDVKPANIPEECQQRAQGRDVKPDNDEPAAPVALEGAPTTTVEHEEPQRVPEHLEQMRFRLARLDELAAQAGRASTLGKQVAQLAAKASCMVPPEVALEKAGQAIEWAEARIEDAMAEGSRAIGGGRQRAQVRF